VSEDDREHERRDLKEFIESNWRRTRVVMSITLTGAIGITLPFVLSRASPNFLFLLAIVGYVIVSPLFGIWFLMRRIREAEKELRPT
jgi:amino acid transporter